MKKLPKIYENEINKVIKNNQEMTKVNKNNLSVEKNLNKIFSGIGYSYNIPVIIKTNDRVYDTSIVTRTKSNILTLDNNIINISDIIEINIKSTN